MSAATGLNYYMAVDESMQGNKIRVKWQGVYTTFRMRFLDANKQEISNITKNPSANTNLTVDENYTIPLNTKWIKYEGTIRSGGYTNYLYEIQPSSEPTFSATNGYMLLHADPTKNINQPYQMVTINYFATSFQRLYRIGTTGEWLNYADKPIKLNHGETIYAKGIRIAITYIIPFAFTSFIPASYFIGKTNLLEALGGTIVAAIVSFIVAYFVWEKGIQVYESAGN
jgi:hypothetical protein